MAIKTDAEGRLDIVYATGPGDSHFAVDVWGEGRAMQRHDWGLDPSKPIPDGETIRLESGESLGGIVQDDQGRPISGATVLLWSHNYRHRGTGGHELLFDLRAISGPDGRWHTSGRRKRLANCWDFASIIPNISAYAITESRRSSPRSPTSAPTRP